MAHFRKKPVVIEAFQWDGVSIPEHAWGWTTPAQAVDGPMRLNDDKTFSITTLEGVMTANPGDYIIRGVKGEIYPCKADIFEMTYDNEDLVDKKGPVENEMKFLVETDKRISYPVYMKTKKYDRLFVIQDRPFIAYYFKDKEVSIEQIVSILEKAESIED
jgi:hypothetical protein